MGEGDLVGVSRRREEWVKGETYVSGVRRDNICRVMRIR